MENQQSVPPTDHRTAMRIVLADGRQLSYSVYGPEEGTPIIMHHGTPGSRVSMEEEVYHKLGVKMIYPERPGYGNSSINPKASFRSWANDVVQLIDHLGLGKVAVAGVSGGGAYTLACAAYYPLKFHSATLIASAAPFTLPEYRKNMALANKVGFWLQRYAPLIARWSSQSFAAGFKKAPEGACDQVNRQLCPSDKDILEEAKKTGGYQVFIDHVNEAFKNGVEGHVTDMKLLSSNWDIPIDKVGCPVYLWHGQEDTLSPLAGAKALNSWIPNSKLEVIPNAGHLIAEKEEVLERVLLRIIRGS